MMEQPNRGSLVFGHIPPVDMFNTPVPIPAYNADGTFKLWRPNERLLLYSFTYDNGGGTCNSVQLKYCTDAFTNDPTNNPLTIHRCRLDANTPHVSLINGYGNYLALPAAPANVDQGSSGSPWTPLFVLSVCGQLSVNFVGLAIGGTGVNPYGTTA